MKNESMYELNKLSVKIEDSDDSFQLLMRNRVIATHTKAIPLFTVGRGKASYIMERGAFKINERLFEKIQLTNYILSQTTNGFIIRFINKNEQVYLEMEVSEQHNKVHFICNAHSEGINRVWMSLPAQVDEHVYGCGEQFTDFDLRGKNVRIWVAEHQNLNRIKEKQIRKTYFRWSGRKNMEFEKYETYYAQPTFISSEKYFVHVDSTAYMEFDFTRPRRHILLIRAVPSKITIGDGLDFESLMENLTDLLGRQPKLPPWIYNGTILGIQGGTEIMLSKIDKSIESGMKVAGVWCQDWQGRRITAFGKQLMWNWRWDENLYPQLDSVIKDLRTRNIRFMGYINPFLAIEGDLYQEASRKGYTVKNVKGEDYLVTITTFPAAMLDLTNPNACVWIKNVIKKNMIDLGLSGWMADFGEYLPVDAVLWSGESAEKLHNVWPGMWAKINREAIEEAGKLGDVVFFTRAGYTENVRYSTLMWSGDQHVDWSVDDGLPSVIPSYLSLSMCGCGLSHSDIGGYTSLYGNTRTKELFMRWAEMSIFTAVMRNHEGNRPDSNIQFDADEEILSFYARTSRIYKSLSTYTKHLVDENANRGIPVIRPVFMYYDEKWAYTEKFQYMFGKDMLIAPVLRPNVMEWDVKLPDDNWIHLWTGKEYVKGTHTIPAALGSPPVFFRKDSAFTSLFETLKNM